jgi:hypothetical protein
MELENELNLQREHMNALKREASEVDGERQRLLK